jgi:hypothetical protein
VTLVSPGLYLPERNHLFLAGFKLKYTLEKTVFVPAIPALRHFDIGGELSN